MKIILSPTKKMKVVDDLPYQDLPQLLPQTEIIYKWLSQQSYDTLKKLWKCNDKIALENVERLQHMNLYSALSPAILSYDGIAFQHMAPNAFEDTQFAYVQQHLRILSAFYGVLRPMDGITPYRLEMQAKASIDGYRDLYDFWNDTLYETIHDDCIINLASDEYSKCIAPYVKEKFITIHFVEEVNHKLVTKGTYAKMARGEMVRYMAEYQIEDYEQIKHFDYLHYAYRPDLSDENNYYFERKRI